MNAIFYTIGTTAIIYCLGRYLNQATKGKSAKFLYKIGQYFAIDEPQIKPICEHTYDNKQIEVEEINDNGNKD